MREIYWIDEYWDSSIKKKWDAIFASLTNPRIEFFRTDHENKDGCSHDTLDLCRKNWCWLTQDLSSMCFWDSHGRCSGACFDPDNNMRKDCGCLCHKQRKKKYLSPFTNEWT